MQWQWLPAPSGACTGELGVQTGPALGTLARDLGIVRGTDRRVLLIPAQHPVAQAHGQEPHRGEVDQRGAGVRPGGQIPAAAGEERQHHIGHEQSAGIVNLPSPCRSGRRHR
ncbi:hypothetical protein [Paeniglutamicibacter psychrophenolicus]|uniref:hypothetical protein n=1 Tax=Paeniglutamicibacter psychrophenolicus TaxID=257454 RepID=UPI001AEA6626|nr:hypothetical protein [Paeniglutamicibacter psychrophenolicus]